MSKKDQTIIVGLDIGTTKVVAIAGQKNVYGKIEIISVGQAESKGVDHGMVVNNELCIRSVKAAIEKCLNSNPNLEIKEVYVGIAGQHIKSLQNRGDRIRADVENEITKAEIDALIQDQKNTFLPAGDEIIDVVPQEYFVDDLLTNISPVGMNGVKIGANFHIVTGNKNAIRNIKRCVERSELLTSDLVLQPMASAAAVVNEDDLEAGVAIVDIGGGTTDMVVFHDNILKHSAVIPYAGSNITYDIHHGLGVLKQQAEQLKVEFGMAIPEQANPNSFITIPGLKGLPSREISVKNLANIIHARTQEILDYVMFNLKQVGLNKRLHGGIIITGGGARLKHITQLTEYVTGLNARIGAPNEHLAGDYPESLNDPKYATCIGLVMRGFNDLENGYKQGSQNRLLHFSMAEENEMEQQIETTEAPMKQGPTKRKGIVDKIFNGLKDKFLTIFEGEEDKSFE